MSFLLFVLPGPCNLASRLVFHMLANTWPPKDALPPPMAPVCVDGSAFVCVGLAEPQLGHQELPSESSHLILPHLRLYVGGLFLTAGSISS